MTQPEASTDYLGIGLALTTACSWAAYILLNGMVERRLPGVQGTAAGTGVSAAPFLPIAAVIFALILSTLWRYCALSARGCWPPSCPYIADLMTLRRIPASLFGLMTSINPVCAALIGAVALHESLGPLEWTGVILIVGANACAHQLRRPVKETPADQQ